MMIMIMITSPGCLLQRESRWSPGRIAKNQEKPVEVAGKLINLVIPHAHRNMKMYAKEETKEDAKPALPLLV